MSKLRDRDPWSQSLTSLLFTYQEIQNNALCYDCELEFIA